MKKRESGYKKIEQELEEAPALILVLKNDEGEAFITNADSECEAKEIASGNKKFTVKKYGVNISLFNSKTGEVIKWKKKEGFSVWKCLPKKECRNFFGVKINNNSLFKG